jgi:hypothetical protein
MAAIEAVKRVNLEDPTMKRGELFLATEEFGALFFALALLIYTDSNLLVKTFQEWIYGWMVSFTYLERGCPGLQYLLLEK